MSHDRRRSQWLWLIIPAFWAIGCLGLSVFPGDEYGMFFGGSIAGSWPLMISDAGFDPTKWFDRVKVVLPTGVIVMAGIGWLIDRLRPGRWTLLALGIWLTLALTMLVTSLRSYPSMARAISKNGSVWAYVFLSWNLSLTAIVLLLLLFAFIRWITIRPRAGACPQCGYDLRMNVSGRCPECGSPVAGETA